MDSWDGVRVAIVVSTSPNDNGAMDVLPTPDSLGRLTTEASNPASERLDELSAVELVSLMNAEDAKVAAAVGAQGPRIAQAIEIIAKQLRIGGRLIYLGSGTSGRLGVLDATECPPTFGTSPSQVVGLIAGGASALTRAIEGAEDRPELAIEDLKAIEVSQSDVVVGIATSGRTPYVIGGLAYARGIGATTIGLSCNLQSELTEVADFVIAPVVGPEVLSGSTRLKAGTATKMVLNMLTTGAMVLLGKTYGNFMVDLRATNAKLESRALRMLQRLTGLSATEARQRLSECGGELKAAIVAEKLKIEPDAARGRLAGTGGQLRAALEN
jgi:N-acetylmuramic acid 6-phosphate etherase